MNTAGHAVVWTSTAHRQTCSPKNSTAPMRSASAEREPSDLSTLFRPAGIEEALLLGCAGQDASAIRTGWGLLSFGDLNGLGTAVAGTTVPGVPRRIRPPGAQAQRRERTARRPPHPSQRPTRPREQPAIRCRHHCQQHPAQGRGPTVRTCFSEDLSASQSSGVSASTAGEAIIRPSPSLSPRESAKEYGSPSSRKDSRV
jgi:hypothetical protein